MRNKTIWIIVVLCLLAVYGYKQGYFKGVGVLSTDSPATFDYQLSLTSCNGTVDQTNSNHILVTLTNATIVNDQNITCNMNLKQKSGSYDSTQPHVVSAKASAYTFSNVDDTSDTVTYRTVTYDVTNEYDIAINGTTYKNLPATVAVDYDTTDIMTVRFAAESFANLNKGLKNNYDAVTLVKIDLTGGKDVTYKYVQTPS